MKTKYPLQEIESNMPYCKAYKFGPCRILVGQEPNIGWHMSISVSKRLPTWQEVHDARYALVPNDVTMVMILPPKEQYVNLHEFCFHLHQIEGE